MLERTVHGTLYEVVWRYSWPSTYVENNFDKILANTNDIANIFIINHQIKKSVNKQKW